MLHRRSPRERRHLGACRQIRELRRERGLSPILIEELAAMDLSQLLEMQRELLKMPVQKKLFDVERGSDRAA